MRKLFLTLFVAGATLVGCKKIKTIEDVTALHVKVIYSTETAGALFNVKGLEFKEAVGIPVTIYKTYDDLLERRNKVASGITNDKGELVLENLEEREYFIEALNDHCLSNLKEIVKKENKVTVKKGIAPTYANWVEIDQISEVELHNKLGKSVYVTVDNDKTKELLEKDKSESLLLAPLFASTKDNYLQHEINLYNSIDDKTPFKTIKIQGNANCEILPVDIQ